MSKMEFIIAQLSEVELMLSRELITEADKNDELNETLIELTQVRIKLEGLFS